MIPLGCAMLDLEKRGFVETVRDKGYRVMAGTPTITGLTRPSRGSSGLRTFQSTSAIWCVCKPSARA